MHGVGTINIHKLLGVCKQLAVQSGHIIRNIRQSNNLGVQVKSTLFGIEDYVTKADFQAQRVIVDGLRQQWPSLRIFAEEDGEDQIDVLAPGGVSHVVASSAADQAIQNVAVWVDPLDATREFTKGTNLECVFCLIGISVLGRPLAGVMHQPFVGGSLGRTISGIVGGGVEGIQTCSPHEGLVATTTALRHTAKNDEAIEAIKPTQVIRVGGAGYKASLVMENKADVYLYNAQGCKLWDTCASHAILKAMGGDMTQVDGSEIIYTPESLGVPSLLASLKNHTKYVNMIASNMKQ